MNSQLEVIYSNEIPAGVRLEVNGTIIEGTYEEVNSATG